MKLEIDSKKKNGPFSVDKKTLLKMKKAQLLKLKKQNDIFLKNTDIIGNYKKRR